MKYISRDQIYEEVANELDEIFERLISISSSKDWKLGFLQAIKDVRGLAREMRQKEALKLGEMIMYVQKISNEEKSTK